MSKTMSKLTVFFESPYWKAIFEREIGDCYEIVKVVFGSEPKDYEVYEFIDENYTKLRFKQSKLEKLSTEKKVGFKRLQKQIKRETQNVGIETKAQKAIKLQFEENKIEKKKKRSTKKKEEQQRKFELKQIKKRENHKGH